MRICKKCNVPMEAINQSELDRRGHKQENIPTQYYCPKCDHSQDDGWLFSWF